MNPSLTSPEFQTTERNHGIDALRGISIVLVMLNHIGIRIPLSKTAVSAVLPPWLMNVLNWRGYEAVFIFFVISGFLITGLIAAALGQSQPHRDQRFLRPSLCPHRPVPGGPGADTQRA